MAGPLAEQVVKTEEFAQAAALFTSVNKAVRAELDKLTARAWHAVNLPGWASTRNSRQPSSPGE